jgi:hypothetical protein
MVKVRGEVEVLAEREMLTLKTLLQPEVEACTVRPGLIPEILRPHDP